MNLRDKIKALARRNGELAAALTEQAGRARTEVDQQVLEARAQQHLQTARELDDLLRPSLIPVFVLDSAYPGAAAAEAL